MTGVGERGRVGHVPGEPGLWVFLFGDLLLFGFLFGAFLVQRIDQVGAFTASQQTLNADLGMINTLLLLTSSLLVALGLAASRTGQQAVAQRLVAGAMALGAGFICVKVLEYHEKISTGVHPGSDDFLLWYLILTGLHLGHVVIGLLLLLVVEVALRRAEPSLPLFEGAACFWHLVDLLWIVLFPLLYLVR